MITYMLHAALLLTVFLGFYKVLLQKETFYSLNRAVLLACMSLCFLLPLFKIPASWSMQGRSEVINVFETKTFERLSPEPATINTSKESVKTSPKAPIIQVNWYDVLLKWTVYLYWFGVAALGLSFIVQLAVLFYTAYSQPAIIDGKFRIVEITGDKPPCSFFNTIFINPEKYDWETYNAILDHEKIHASQGHSLDIMLAEIVLVFLWFNPFAWLYRRELESNLEYLTDEAVLEKNETSKAVYQESLLKVTVPQLALRLTANYNQSLLKKRLVRMDVKKSNLHTLWKYSFLLPLCFLLICAFNTPMANSNQGHIVEKDKTETNILYLMTSEGLWYAAVEEQKVNIYLRPVNAGNKSSAQLTVSAGKMNSFIKGDKDEFKLSREAGTLILTGEFDKEKGLGQYQFIPDTKYQEYLTKEGISDLNSKTQLAFFFLNITREYVNGLLADEPLKLSGKEIIGAKSEEIRKDARLGHSPELAGKFTQLTKHSESSQNGLARKIQNPDTNNRDGQFAHLGLTDLSNNDHRSFTSLKINADYIKSWQQYGYPNISSKDIIALKVFGVTQNYANSFKALGYTNISASELTQLKSQSVSANYINDFNKIGINAIPLRDVIAAKIMRFTPQDVAEMRSKGQNFRQLSDFTRLTASNKRSGGEKGEVAIPIKRPMEIQKRKESVIPVQK